MNGARAVLPVTTINKPNKTSMITIGASQSFFLIFRKSINSPRISTLLMIVNLSTVVQKSAKFKHHSLVEQIKNELFGNYY